jgi:beta-N-acetylhexosaminidase
MNALIRALHIICAVMLIVVSRAVAQTADIHASSAGVLPVPISPQILLNKSGEAEPKVRNARKKAPTSDRSRTDTRPYEMDDESLIASLSLRQKVGQLFLIGFMGHELDSRLTESIEFVKPGGLIFFGRNIRSAHQIIRLNSEAQKLSIGNSRLPLLIGVDQEGGNVLRIKTAMPLPSALAFGASGDHELAQLAGEATGRLLKVLGFNVNFAPVLDVAGDEKPSFLGTRAFGRDPEVVGRMATSFAFGLEKHGILSTGKHFPGHGGVSEDSHQQTPEKEVSLDEISKGDLVPFQMMKSRFEDRWSVMLAHVAYPKLDPSGMPATFSKPIVDGLLRKKMGFQGLVITDDIEMAGAFAVKDASERAIRAIEVGVDMIMVAWNRRLQNELVLAVENAVRSGRIPESRVDESVKRILAAKRRVAWPRDSDPTDNEIRLAVQNPAFGEIAERTVRSRFEGPFVPSQRTFKAFAETKPVLVFSANQRFNASFRDALRNRSVRVFPIDPERPDLIDRVMRSNPRAVGVFYLSSKQVAKIVNKISADSAGRMLVVSVETQSLLRRAEDFRHIVDVYYRHPALGRLVAEHFFNPARAPENPPLRQPASAKGTSRMGLNRERDE